MSHRIGVCSWSLSPKNPAELAAACARCGIHAVQLALDPIRRREWEVCEVLRVLESRGIRVVSGMMAMQGEDYSTLESIARTGGVRPDATWSDNLDAARANADLARELGIGLVTFHAGFLAPPADPQRGKMISRIASIAERFAAQGVGVALETGQETPESLLELLGEPGLEGVGVNFDPANMLLYGSGDPIRALEALAQHIVQVHLKDAVGPDRPGVWGTETPAGRGAVDWEAFFSRLDDLTPDVDVIIERERGPDRTGDVVAARELAERYGASV